jgi:glutathione S-transferase
MNLVHVVALLAVAQYFAFGVLAGRARAQYAVKAPAVSGHEQFERALRVQMNTLEQLVAFLPTLFIAAQYWSGGLVAGVGVVYLVGRLLYRQAYVTDPGKRQAGFLLTVLPTATLFVLALIGVVMHR